MAIFLCNVRQPMLLQGSSSFETGRRGRSREGKRKGQLEADQIRKKMIALSTVDNGLAIEVEKHGLPR